MRSLVIGWGHGVCAVLAGVMDWSGSLNGRDVRTAGMRGEPEWEG